MVISFCKVERSLPRTWQCKKSILVLLVSFLCFAVALQASTTEVQYKKFDISKQWSKARTACKQESKILAQIDNIDLFNSTKEKLYKASSGQGKVYWTGLRYRDKLLWSDGKQTFCNGSLSAILNCTHVNNLIYERCFIIQENFDTLRAKQCDIAERYICQSGKSFIPLVSQVSSSSSNLIKFRSCPMYPGDL